MTIKVTGKKQIDKSKIRRILVRATNWVGDVVMTIPALEAVRENFPESRLAVLARPWVIPLLETHPAVDQVLPLRKGKGYPVDVIELIRVACLIRRMRFDLAILFQNAFEAAFLACVGGIRYRVGYNTDGRRLLLSHTLIRNDELLNLHQVEYYLTILKAMGWEARTRDPNLFVADKDKESVRSLLMKKGVGEDDFLLGLSPGAVFGPAKRWPPDRFAAIGDWAAERWGATVLIIGSEGEKDIGMRLETSMKHAPVNLCGMTSLGEAMALINRCHMFVTNDSGLMHIGAALNVPVVAIFGSTDPVATGPRGQRSKVVRKPMDCAPCLRPVCPTDYRCLLSIEPEEVWKEMEDLKKVN